MHSCFVHYYVDVSFVDTASMFQLIKPMFTQNNKYIFLNNKDCTHAQGMFNDEDVKNKNACWGSVVDPPEICKCTCQGKQL